MAIVGKLIGKLKSLRESEPVRTTVYPLLIVGLGILVGSGKLSSDTSDLIASAIGLGLGITAAEAARAKVTPAAKVAEAVSDVVFEVRQAGVSPDVQEILDRARQTVTDAIGKHRRIGE